MTEEPHLLVNEEGDILVATFNRPDKLNAMSQELMRRLELGQLRRDVAERLAEVADVVRVVGLQPQDEREDGVQVVLGGGTDVVHVWNGHPRGRRTRGSFRWWDART